MQRLNQDNKITQIIEYGQKQALNFISGRYHFAIVQ